MTMRGKTTSYRNHTRQRITFAYLSITPAILGVLLFTVAPLLYCLYLSFTKWDIFHAEQWIGFGNYHKIFTEDLFFTKSLRVTAYYSFGNVLACIVFCFIVALLLNQNIRGRAFFRSVFYLPSVIPILATSLIWYWLYDIDFGVINHILGWFGIPKQMWVSSPGTVIPSIIIMSVWASGNIIVIFLAGLQDVPRHLLEAVEIDGGGWWSKLRSVTIPLMSPVIFYNIILAFVNSVTTFTQTYTLGTQGGGPNDSALFYAFLIYREAFKHMNMGYACALAMVLFVIVSVLTLLLFRVSRFWVHYEGGRD
ncbi:sugar ABC transporter permease [Paenibacillus albus]|uniref:Sugar ABC transporter permease n=2 Tax=Paenibacillus albus TaxID=2495582 RepID=A0A3Q8X459_9BACL|nr:sugar ABC transporter permease [Paenibacillus albus]